MADGDDDRFAALEEHNAELEVENVALRARVAELNDQVAVLTGKLADLEKMLGRNSSNSSMPPSTDPGAAKTKRPENANRAARRALARKQGKQPGTPGVTLAQVTDPDEVVVHQPQRCRACERSLDARLASEVTSVDDASTVLERLVDANIATRLVGDWGEPAYRYHDLFAEFLRIELARTFPKDHIAELHRRAAVAASTDGEAIEHLLAAELWNEAADRMEAVGRAQQVLTVIRLPASILDALPAEIRQSRTWIRLMRAAIDVR